MTGPHIEPDDQDQSEIFDETHIDDEGEGDLLLDEAGPVLDVTREDSDGGDGDDDDDAGGDQPLDPEQPYAPDIIEAEADVLLGEHGRRTRVLDDDDGSAGAPDEVELVYSGLMRNARGAQASAAHWEARHLSEDDLAALGYGPRTPKEPQQGDPT
jgi:hypothetical protein